VKTVDFLFDFGSPNAYLSHRVVPDIEKRTGARFVYVPVLLGGIFKLTNNQPPMVAFGNIKNKMPYEMLETRRFVARHRLAAFTFNPHFPVNTLVLMRAAVAADAEGQLAPYVEAVFQHMWERGTKMDDPAVCRAALLESGLDADRLLSRAQDQDVKDTLMRNTQEAVDRGAFGIPTFFVGSEIYFGKDRLRDVEDEITRSSS
jgi:2-hydroxychromene-2-carboxylate isomerase